jgi:hypothetical protein
MSPSRSQLMLVAVLALAFGAAPTVGDVGSCGSPATDLDPGAFAASRKGIDCRRCTDCGLSTETCRNDCDPNASGTAGWPSMCHPLEHDGEVCLRALLAASCSSYASFVDDVAPTVPTECDFCRLVPESGVTGRP